MRYIKSINEKRPKGSPKWHDADWPDAEGRFKDLNPKDLAAWLIKTRKGDMSAISGSLTQQVVFSRKKDPEHAEKMEKTRKEVYKQMDRKDLLNKMDESMLNEAEETYNDYPAAAKKNAQMAIDWKEKYGREEVDAGTAVGWARAHQLAKGEKISADTISRMASFNRHRKNSKIATEYKDTPWKDKGYVAWLIWGGDEGVDWAMKKSKKLNKMEESKYFKPVKSYSDFINEGLEMQGSSFRDDNDPVLVAFRAAKERRRQEAERAASLPSALKPAEVKKLNSQLDKIGKELNSLYRERNQLLNDMEQEAEAEGGSIADEYGAELDKLEEKIAKLITRRKSIEFKLAR